VRLAGEGLTAMFDGPARAVQCAAAVAMASGLRLRAGVHIGELDPAGADGAVVRISRQLAAAAAPGEVLVSRTIVDLVPGSGLHFDERGTVTPAGVDREIPVMALRQAP
jgi:class 3 adenylate cyclase